MGNFDIEKQNTKHKYRKRSKRSSSRNKARTHNGNSNYNEDEEELDPNINNKRYAAITEEENKKLDKIAKKLRNNKSPHNHHQIHDNSQYSVTNIRKEELPLPSTQSKLYEVIDALTLMLAKRDSYEATNKETLIKESNLTIRFMIFALILGFLGWYCLKLIERML